jgi:hypothetical protein
MPNSSLDKVLVRNPATNQTMTATRKQFDSVYRDKGFELVGRGTDVKPATGKPAKSKDPRAGDNIGTAASIAASLGVTGSKTEGLEKPPTGSHVDPATGRRVIGETPPAKELPNEAKSKPETEPATSGNAAKGDAAGNDAGKGVAGPEGGSNAVDANNKQPGPENGN